MDHEHSPDQAPKPGRGITIADYVAREMARPNAIVTHHPADETDALDAEEAEARYFLEDRESALITLALGRFPVHEAWVDRPDEYLRVSRENLEAEAAEFRQELAQLQARRAGYVEITYQPAPARSVNCPHQGRAPRRAANSRSTGSRRAGSSSSSSSSDPGSDDSDGESDPEPPARGPAPRPGFTRPWRHADGRLAERTAALDGLGVVR